MSNFVGMDPAEIRQIGRMLEGQSRRLAEVAHTVDVLVRRAVAEWNGQSAHQFAQAWTSTLRPKFASAQSSMHHMAQVALQNADEQERASGNGGPGSRGRSSTGGPLPSDKTDLNNLAPHLKFWGLDVPSLGFDLHDVYKESKGFKEIVNFLSQDVRDVVKVGPQAYKSVGGAFAIAGSVTDGYAMADAIARGDEPEAWRAFADLAAGIATAGVPGGSIAWYLGTKAGEGIYAGVESVYPWTDNAYKYALESAYGVGATPLNLTQAQIDDFNKRYDGIGGLFVCSGDHARAIAIDSGKAIGGALEEGRRLADGAVHEGHRMVDSAIREGGKMMDGAVHEGHRMVDSAIREGGKMMDGAVQEGQKFVEGMSERIKGVKFPWQR